MGVKKVMELRAVRAEDRSKRLETIRRAPKTRSRDLAASMLEKGVVPTPKQACLIMCGECCGWFVDGRHDCEVEECGLYYYMPYGRYRRVRVRGGGGGEIPKGFRKKVV